MANGRSRLRDHIRGGVALALAAVLIASCGDDDSAKADTGDFCATFGEHVGEITGSEGAEDGPEVQASFERLLPALDTLDQQAPAEISSEMRDVSAFLREIDPVIARYDYSFERAAAEGTDEDIAFLSSGGPIQSYDAVLAFVRANCPGVDFEE
jgi:hypothetical protein